MGYKFSRCTSKNRKNNIWSKRKLALPGRITVTKSLELSLPNPPDECPDKISRNNTIRNEREGGLRMIKIRTFISQVHNFKTLIIKSLKVVIFFFIKSKSNL